ncbi:sialate O-acetylesterase [Paraglaciecola sp. L3A3]|uniref:sialate O-acetylesterase n=1 Tax=Paraglaciecola sp. L3A3 TaxID=2686358 RepID=UPI00131D38A8|nr:sialate O-acetylesterase [Paraglaciecola sp. L3A3]
MSKIYTALFHIVIYVSLSVISFNATALSVSKLFQDNMIIQREQAFIITGTALPLSEIQVVFNQTRWTTTADKTGDWQLSLPAEKAGGPHKLHISSDKTTKTINNIYFGDVWIASGQSNMEWKLSWTTENWQTAVEQAKFPLIRFFNVAKSISPIPKNAQQIEGQWIMTSPETVKDFSAVAWYFAKAIYQQTNVPIGIINSSWGGTPIEAWTPDSMVKGSSDDYPNPSYLDPIHWQKKLQISNEKSKLRQKQLHNETSFKELQLASNQYDDNKWQRINLPGKYLAKNILWLRKSLNLSEISINKPSMLSVGFYPNHFEVFINNQRVFKRAAHQPLGEITIPAGILKNGNNTIAIRTANDWSNFNQFALTDQFYLENNQQKINLTGEWRVNNTLETPLVSATRYQGNHSVLYNAMIHPLIDFKAKGVIWYQGESNTGRAHLYQTQFKNLITSWRDKWQQKNLPFYYVQLANYKERVNHPVESGWAEIRQAQLDTLSVANTGMAVTIDVGNSLDVHPRNKKTVGERLAAIARAKLYDENIPYSGPLIETITQADKSLILEFKHAKPQLIAKGQLLGFEIAGIDATYQKTSAKIVNNRVILDTQDINTVCSVRYAWSDNPVASLINLEGFPASPFQSFLTENCVNTKP